MALLCGLLLPGRADGSPGTKGAWPIPPQTWLRDVACIARWESGNGTTSRNIYGMLDGWHVAHGVGRPESASRAEQTYRAWLLYCWSLRKYGNGWLPWPEHRTKCGLG